MKVSWNFEVRYGAILLCKAIQNASIKTWKIIKDGQAAIMITKNDIETLKIKSGTGRMIWDTEAGKEEYEFDLDEQFLKFMREKIRELDVKNMIPSDLLPLAEALGIE